MGKTYSVFNETGYTWHYNQTPVTHGIGKILFGDEVVFRFYSRDTIDKIVHGEVTCSGFYLKSPNFVLDPANREQQDFHHRKYQCQFNVL